MRKDIEVLVVVGLSVVTPVIALRAVALNPGFIFGRDLLPPFYLPPRQFAVASLGFPAFMSNEIALLALLPYFGLLSSEQFERLLFLAPFSTSVLSTYFACRHLLGKYLRVQGVRAFLISSFTAVLYALTLTAYYFSHWPPYAFFYSLLPALIAGTDYSIDLGGVKGALILALLCSASSTDPRGFLFTLLVSLSYSIYRSWRGVKTFISSIPLFLAFNSRLFLLLFYSFRQFDSISLSISNSQLWLNYYTFPLLDSMRGLGLFRPLVPTYSSQGIFTAVYLFSFALPEFAVLGYLALRRRPCNYLVGLYLVSCLAISSGFPLLRYWVRLDLLYPVWGFLSQTWVYTYLWLVLPTYISEMVLAPLFLLFAMVWGSILGKKWAVPLLVFVIASQVSFSYPAAASGNYFGQYVPVQEPGPIQRLVQDLSNYTGGTLTLGYVPSSWAGFYSSLPHEVFLPFPLSELSNGTKLGRVLDAFGVQIVVLPEFGNYTWTKDFLGDQKDLKLLEDTGYFLIYLNLDYHEVLNSPIYILYDYPESVKSLEDFNFTPIVLPSYLQWGEPRQLVGGMIGYNQTQADEIAFKAYLEGVQPLQLKLKRLPYPSNFTYTVSPDAYNAFLAGFPGVNPISVSGNVKVSLGETKGEVEVLISYLSSPYGGTFEVSNGSKSGFVDLTGEPEVKWAYLGEMMGNLTLIHLGQSTSYLLQVLLVPKSSALTPLSVSNTTAIFSQNSWGREISVGQGTEEPGITSFFIVNALTAFSALGIALGWTKFKGVRGRDQGSHSSSSVQ
jgi:hypothetical protein